MQNRYFQNTFIQIKLSFQQTEKSRLTETKLGNHTLNLRKSFLTVEITKLFSSCFKYCGVSRSIILYQHYHWSQKKRVLNKHIIRFNYFLLFLRMLRTIPSSSFSFRTNWTLVYSLLAFDTHFNLIYDNLIILSHSLRNFNFTYYKGCLPNFVRNLRGVLIAPPLFAFEILFHYLTNLCIYLIVPSRLLRLN